MTNKVFLSLVMVILVVLFGIGGAVVGVHNELVELEEGVDSAWSQVENVYQRRADLVPNLVAVVKGARDFESETLQAVVEARSRVGEASSGASVPDASGLSAFQQRQDELSGALTRLMAVVESYPEITANEAFRDLQAQLEGTENRIAVERRRFNKATEAFNTACRKLPGYWVAGLFGLETKAYFEADPGAENPPDVDLSE